MFILSYLFQFEWKVSVKLWAWLQFRRQEMATQQEVGGLWSRLPLQLWLTSGTTHTPKYGVILFQNNGSGVHAQVGDISTAPPIFIASQ